MEKKIGKRDNSNTVFTQSVLLAEKCIKIKKKGGKRVKVERGLEGIGWDERYNNIDWLENQKRRGWGCTVNFEYFQNIVF